jgi:hypothetical protein
MTMNARGRTTAITVRSTVAGYIIALLCCALASWDVEKADTAVRILMPLSGGIKHLGRSISHGVAVACWTNAAIYGAVGCLIGILLPFFEPAIKRWVD